MSKEFDDLVNQKAQTIMRCLIELNLVRSRPDTIAEIFPSVLTMAHVAEIGKRSRIFTIGPPTDQEPFTGCDGICDIPGRRGGAEGPNDHCTVIHDSSGNLYFCRAPNGGRLPDGSLPLCFDYHQTEWNADGIQKVKNGALRIFPKE